MSFTVHTSNNTKMLHGSTKIYAVHFIHDTVHPQHILLMQSWRINISAWTPFAFCTSTHHENDEAGDDNSNNLQQQWHAWSEILWILTIGLTRPSINPAFV